MKSTTCYVLGLVVVASACSGRAAIADLFLSTPTKMPAPLNSNHADYSPNVSSDNLELYFASTRPGPYGLYSTWVARRDSPSDPFGIPEPVTSLNHPSISSDGLSLYGNLITENGTQDLFVVTRLTTDASWGEPVDLGSSINTIQHERNCHISTDGLEFYFERGWDNPASSSAIWVAKRSNTSEPFGEPERLPAHINGPRGTWIPEILHDDLTLIFASERPGGFGLDDLWVSTRPTKDDGWGEPMNLGPEVNSYLYEDTADVSPDGQMLYFARSDSTDLGANWHLWQAQVISETSLGDLNLDGDVNGLDVDPFVEVLLNGTDDNATQVRADMNSDGEVNGLDVDPFVAAVIGSGAQSIPEPSTLLLCLLALGVVGSWRKWGG